jgi:hypothetical protein
VEEIRWMQKYIQGKEWTPPKRPVKKKDHHKKTQKAQ